MTNKKRDKYDGIITVDADKKLTNFNFILHKNTQ